jgi:hypothetical protein
MTSRRSRIDCRDTSTSVTTRTRTAFPSRIRRIFLRRSTPRSTGSTRTSRLRS